jgi:hypothetical protein
MVVLQTDTDTSECDHRKGENEIDDKDIVEDLLSKHKYVRGFFTLINRHHLVCQHRRVHMLFMFIMNRESES